MSGAGLHYFAAIPKVFGRPFDDSDALLEAGRIHERCWKEVEEVFQHPFRETF